MPIYPDTFGNLRRAIRGAAVVVPTLAFANPTASISEGNTGTQAVPNTVNVTRNGVTGALVVNLAYAATATAGSDYVAGPASVTIADGANSVSFDLAITGDTTVEPDETIVIVASLAAYPTATATKTITVLNDDLAAPSSAFFGSSSQSWGASAPVFGVAA